MRNILRALALILALLPVAAAAQQFNTIPPNTVIGRLGAGTSGPAQAIPFANFLPNLTGVQSANKVFAGPTSGGTALPSFRSLVGADLPPPGASSLGGVQSLTCASSNWFNTLSTAGAFGCSQPNFTDLAGSIAGGQIGAGVITSTMILDGTILNADINATAAIALSKLATQVNNTFVGNVSGSTAVPVALTPGQVGGALCVPSRSVFISGVSQTYTTPTCNGITATWLEVDLQGGGAGGGGSGTTITAGVAGNNSVFGALTANGGGASAGGASAGGAGGACSGSLGTQQNFPGSAGSAVGSTTANQLPGGVGGISFYGGAGYPTASGVAGQAAPANSGGGGSGGSGNGTAGVLNGPGGGAGCHIRTLITTPAATVTYTVGAAVAGGSAGTSGQAGGGGAAGLLDVVAHWQ